MTRRGLLAGGVAALALVRAAPAAAAPALRAAPAEAQLAPADMPRTPVWAYEGTVPGPELRLPQGARLTRRFVNGLPQPSTVHWHGLRLPNAMDGVPGLTQRAVEPGGEFLYDFPLTDAGTYWYHPHNRTFEQAARGLYGALVVEEAAPPEAEADRVLVLDDWRLDAGARIEESFGAMHDRAHGGRIGNWITVNGAPEWTARAARHDRLRLRLVNAANARIFTLGLVGLAGWVVALDGQPLDMPEPVAERFRLAPAQRMDLLLDVTGEPGGEAFLVSHEREGGFAVASLAIGPGPAAPRPAPAPLPPNPVPPLGPLAGARRLRLVMEGGAMGRMEHARIGAERLGMRELVGRGMAWAFNGHAGMPAEPLVAAAPGETLRIEMVNDTAWPHAMHLHGHHFRRIGADGRPGPLRDTLLMDRGETAEIAFVADNPGSWLLHCHMLEHAASGMMTWLRVG